MESSTFPKNACPLLLFLSLVPFLAELCSHNFFFLPPAVLSLSSSSPLPSAFILLRSALPAVGKVKQMALACVFCTPKACEMMGSFGASLPVCQEGQLMFSTVIRNTRLQQSGFTAFPASHQEMSRGCTFLHRYSIAFPKNIKLVALGGLCFIMFPYTNTKMSPFYYRAVPLFET